MKGINFKPDMIQAIIEGRKTQTRRVIKPQPPDDARLIGACDVWGWQLDGVFISESKPRYQVGETVYIKERALYWVSPILEGVEYDKPSDWWSDCVYQDDPEIPALLADNGRFALERSINQIVEGNSIIGKWEWKSPLHMPEHYARYFLVITDVRAERLQEITEGGCYMEGVNKDATCYIRETGKYTEERTSNPRVVFEWLWNSINKDYPWESNPWVFVYTFRIK